MLGLLTLSAIHSSVGQIHNTMAHQKRRKWHPPRRWKNNECGFTVAPKLKTNSCFFCWGKLRWIIIFFGGCGMFISFSRCYCKGNQSNTSSNVFFAAFNRSYKMGPYHTAVWNLALAQGLQTTWPIEKKLNFKRHSCWLEGCPNHWPTFLLILMRNIEWSKWVFRFNSKALNLWSSATRKPRFYMGPENQFWIGAKYPINDLLSVNDLE